MLYRFDFGTSLENIPVAVNLGNPGNLLSHPEGFDLINHKGNWYGFVGYEDNGGHLVRLEFGNSLANYPTGKDIGSFVPGRIRDLRLLMQDDNLILVFLHYNTNEVYRVNYRNSFENTISPEHIFTSVIPGASLPTGIEITRICDSWIVHIVSLGNNSVQQINFGNNLLSEPVEDWNFNFNSVIKPYRITVINEGNDYYAAIGNERDPVALINLSDLRSSTIPVEIDNTGFPVSQNVYSVDYNGKKALRCISSAFVKSIEFEADCASGISYSYEKIPGPIEYQKEGSYGITVKLQDYGSLSGIQVDSVHVLNLEAPAISFRSDNSCFSSMSTFNSESTDVIKAWNWDFGDGSTGEGQKPEHQFLAAGNYPVMLEVLAENGCRNYFNDTVRIYEPPVADFRIEDSAFCSNHALTFRNQSIMPAPDSLASYSWDFNDEDTSTAKDTIYAFPAGGTKTITLNASIPGCVSEKTVEINLLEGPDVHFSFQEVCSGDTVHFLNETSGETKGWLWDFGDGSNSSAVNPAHLYDEPGSYSVTLLAEADNGCVNEHTRMFDVHHLPKADFTHELPCSRSAVGFFDASTVHRANINGWYWFFRHTEDSQTSGSDIRPDAVFDLEGAGDYEVSLTVTSNYGCRDSISRIITALPAPVADFEHNLACLGDTTFFRDLSSVEKNLSIDQWVWQIGETTLFEPSPAFVLPGTGPYAVRLTVRADNRCRNTTVREISLNPLPEADFIVENHCENDIIRLNSTSVSFEDLIKEYTWNIEGLGTLTGSQVETMFPEAGDYLIGHSIITEYGCRDSVSRKISIDEAPLAGFGFDPESGGAPLRVNFINESTGGTTYRWDFDDDGKTSELNDPAYIYSSMGIYTPSLKVINDKGCSDSTSAWLQVADPVLDVTLRKAQSAALQGTLYFYLEIENNGTLAVEDMDIAIKPSGGPVIRESFSGVLQAGEQIRYPVNFRIYDLPDQMPDYLCFRLIPQIDGQAEIDTLDNAACISITPDPLVNDPYPNPSSGPFRVDLILPGQQDVQLQLIGNDGKIFWTRTYPGVSAGLNSFILETDAIGQGNYLLRISVDDRIIVKKIGIKR